MDEKMLHLDLTVSKELKYCGTNLCNMINCFSDNVSQCDVFDI